LTTILWGQIDGQNIAASFSWPTNHQASCSLGLGAWGLA